MPDNHHHHARLSRLRTTSQLLRRSTTFLSSHPLTFLFLTCLLFSFHSLVDHCSLLLTSFVDRDPSLRSLLSQLPLHPPTRRYHHLRPPFLHLTRLGTLDDDFFSTDEYDPHLQGSSSRAPLNATTVILSGFDSISGFSRPIADNGLLLPQIIRSGFNLRQLSSKEDDRDSDDDKLKFNESEQNQETDEYPSEKNYKELERFVDLKLFLKGLELGRHDAATVFFLVSFLFGVYGWVILGFTIVYSLVLAIIFVTVINDILGRFPSFLGVFWTGSKLGFKRVTGFILMKWALRDALTQLLSLWYFGEVKDQYSFFRLFLRVKLMPFTVMPPWIKGFEKEISGFLFAWFLLDALIGLVLAVDAFIAIVDSRRRGREILKEGLYLISLMLLQALQLKLLEAILCGSVFRWVLVRNLGKSFAYVIQSALEVYFMTAWLVFYLVARCKDAHTGGRRFGRREMANLIDGLR